MLDTTLTDELILEGYAREIVSRLQNLRKDSGLEVTDRVHISYAGDDALKNAAEMFKDYITGETLGMSLVAVTKVSSNHQITTDIDGHGLTLGLVKV